jgi:hypothetical protein
MLKSTILCAIAILIATPALAQYSSYNRGYDDAEADAQYRDTMRLNQQRQDDWRQQMEQDRLNHQREMDEMDRRARMDQMQHEIDTLRQLGR